MPAITAAQAADNTQGGWGHLIALVVAGLLFWAGSAMHKRWTTTAGDHSPAALPSGNDGANPQVSGVPGTPGTPSGKAPDGLAVFVAQNAGKTRTEELVRAAQRRYGASRRTVLRRLNEARKGGAR